MTDQRWRFELLDRVEVIEARLRLRGLSARSIRSIQHMNTRELEELFEKDNKRLKEVLGETHRDAKTQ